MRGEVLDHLELVGDCLGDEVEEGTWLLVARGLATRVALEVAWTGLCAVWPRLAWWALRRLSLVAGLGSHRLTLLTHLLSVRVRLSDILSSVGLNWLSALFSFFFLLLPQFFSHHLSQFLCCDLRRIQSSLLLLLPPCKLLLFFILRLLKPSLFFYGWLLFSLRP